MKRIAKPKRHYYVCIDGPWAGLKALMPKETMIMTANGQTGKYLEGVWYTINL